MCCSARAGLQAPQARAQAGSSAARREHAQASHERTLNDCAHCVNRRAQLMTFRAGSMSGRAASDPSILVSAHRCPFGPPSTA